VKRVVNTFWAPAIAALVAVNPDRAENARAFAIKQRDAELIQYRPSIALYLNIEAARVLSQETESSSAVTSRVAAATALARTADGTTIRQFRDDELSRCLTIPGTDPNLDRRGCDEIPN